MPDIDGIPIDLSQSRAAPGDSRPPWQYRESHYHEVVDAALPALVDAGCELYRRGHELIEVSRDTATLAPVRVERLRQLLNAHWRWMRLTLDSGVWVGKEVACPTLLAPSILALPGYGVPELAGVIRAPTLRPDGSLLHTPGYDVATNYYLLPDGVVYPPVPEEPTLQECQKSLGRLYRVVADFPFRTELDRAAWLAYLLTAAARASVAGPTPFFLSDASIKRSGKGMLINVAGWICHGEAPDAKTMPPADPYQEAAAIVAMFRTGKPIVHLDNVTRPIQGDTYEGLATSYTYAARLLGTPDDFRATNSIVWACSGNNIQVGGDMGPRCVRWRLEPKAPNPEDRSDFRIREPLKAYCLRRRGQLLVDALTVLRWGRQHQTQATIPGWGGMDEWSAAIRRPVLALTGLDVRDSRPLDVDRSVDEDEQVSELLALAWQAYGAEEWDTAALLAHPVIREPVMRIVSELLAGKKPGQEAVHLGSLLGRKFKGKPLQLEIGGVFYLMALSQRRGRRWAIVQIS